MLFALYDALRLATLLICVGAANALASPARLLKSLPGALYEAGVAVVVAMTFAPNLVADVRRLRAARRLRGRPDRGLRGLFQVGLPVLEGALERSVALAAAMDARGYGRTADVPPAVRRTTAVLTVGGLIGVCLGTYGLLADQGGGFGVPVLALGLAAALAGLWLGGRRSVRSRYRPDRWGCAPGWSPGRGGGRRAPDPSRRTGAGPAQPADGAADRAGAAALAGGGGAARAGPGVRGAPAPGVHVSGGGAVRGSRVARWQGSRGGAV